MSRVQELKQLLAEINHDPNSPLWDDVDELMKDLLPDDHFIDRRYFVGQPVKVLRGTGWQHGEAHYVKSELRPEPKHGLNTPPGGVWHMVQFRTAGAAWIPDGLMILPNICGNCQKDCAADDYLCYRCRSTQLDNVSVSENEA